ncbi:class I SAM-dependent methyltransferase [Haloechinothrix salitolerans]|uniref:Class I SAM-dependent methyltransferase n=1 Tax=Haloechinothrix salitolerans TaxID=926830 RepID=A0ABW2BWX9_9PSEU
MTQTRLDPVQHKEQQRANWDGASEGWLAISETFERGAREVTAELLELGGVREGMTVLDAATGIGEPALTAARVVGPEGRVVGFDLAPGMVAIARRRAAEYDNIEFRVGDIESAATGEFDVALCRWGLMFAIDTVAALRSLAGALRPGGVLAASTWGPAETVPMLSLGFQALSGWLEMPAPPPEAPTPFSLSDPGTLAADLETAGFVDVSVTEFDVPFSVADPAEYIELNKAVTPPPMRDLLREQLGEDEEMAWRAVGDATLPFRDVDGTIRLPSTALCVRAVKAAS